MNSMQLKDKLKNISKKIIDFKPLFHINFEHINSRENK